MKVIYIKSREIFGLVREGSPSSDYIHYRPLQGGLGRSFRVCSENDVLDLTAYIKDPTKWQQSEIEMINMIIPELSVESMHTAAKFAKIAE